MASVSLKDIIAKMKLENLTPELDIAKVKIAAGYQQARCRWRGISNILRRLVCRSLVLWNILICWVCRRQEKKGDLYETAFL